MDGMTSGRLGWELAAFVGVHCLAGREEENPLGIGNDLIQCRGNV